MGFIRVCIKRECSKNAEESAASLMNQCQKSQSFTTDVFQQSMRNYKRNTNLREGTNRKWPTGGMISWAVLFREKLPHHSTTHENVGYFHSLPIITKASRKIIMQVF